MTKDQMTDLYKTACAGKGFKPNDPQLKLWQSTMGYLEHADLAQAIVWFFEANTGFPMPAELKPLAEKSRHQRTASGLGWIVTYECPDCHLTFVSVHKDEQRPPKTCRAPYRNVNGKLTWLKQEDGWICGGILNIIEDRREVMVKPDQGAAA